MFASAEKKKNKTMHDFCLTFPYGFLVALGGLIGFATKGACSLPPAILCAHLPTGSLPSLLAGGGSGVVLLLLAVLSLKAWKTGKAAASAPFTALSAGVAGLLTFAMGKRYLATQALFPAGVVAGLSAAMLLFYAHNLLSGGNPLPKEVAEAKTE